MKTTVTLYEYISSELVRNGYNEFLEGNQIISREHKKTIMYKFIAFDDDVYNIVNDRIFIDFKLNDEIADKKFKRNFCNRFLDAEIKTQTIETHASKVLYTCLENEVFLNEVYTNLIDYINDLSVNDTMNGSNTVSDNRSASSDLPSNEVNTNVDNLELIEATNNNISRYKTTTDGDSNSKTKKMNIENLLKVRNLLEDLFKTFDKNCFLQTW